MARQVIKAQLTGLEDVKRRLGKVKAGVARKLTRQAVTKGTKLVLNAAKGLVPVGPTGLLKKSLGSVIKTYSSGAVVGIVGPRTGFTKTGRGKKTRRKETALGAKFRAAGVRPTLYAHLVEFGTRPHAIGKGSLVRKGIQRGRGHPGSKAQPFLGPAWTGQETAVTEVIRTTLEDGIRDLAT